jgi:outer membrane protein TolC
VDEYLEFALRQNPGIQAARNRVLAVAHRVPQAASLKDPMLGVQGWPFYPYVPQQAAGRMTVDVMLSQEVPWRGKLCERAAVAQAEVHAARAELAAVELQTIEEVKRAYYQLHLAENSIEITQQSRELLADVLDIANVRFTTGKTSQQDVLRLQAELSTVDGEIVRLKQELQTAIADLAQLLHISPDTPLQTVSELVDEEVPEDLDALYQQAVTARPELHKALADVRRDRHKVELANLDYYPDFTLSAGWGEMTTNRALALESDGLDQVTVGLGVNLPIYRDRLDAGVREAEAQVRANAREYDLLRDKTLRDVKVLFAQASSQLEQARLFRESIIPNTQQALNISIREYEVGTAQFVQMIDTWRELLRMRIMQQQLESQLRQTIASLARTVGAGSRERRAGSGEQGAGSGE